MATWEAVKLVFLPSTEIVSVGAFCRGSMWLAGPRTPTVVRVGYLPGYVGSYVYGGTVVFGTGYVYRPWLGAYYYPRPVTWGVRVVYNPWSGGWTYAPAYGGWYGAAFAASRVYWGGAYAGWWGPNGYRYGGNTYKYKYKYNYNVNVNRPPGYRPPATQLPSRGNATQLPFRGNPTQLPANRPGFAEGGRRPGNDNIYNRPENRPIRGGGERPTQLPADRTRPGSGASQLPADRIRPGAGASQLPAGNMRPGQGASQQRRWWSRRQWWKTSLIRAHFSIM